MNGSLALAALVLVLTATTPLFAQSGADFRVTIEADPPGAVDVERRVPIGSSIPFVVRFEWHGEPARNVAIEVDVPGRVTEVWTARNETMTCTDSRRSFRPPMTRRGMSPSCGDASTASRWVPRH